MHKTSWMFGLLFFLYASLISAKNLNQQRAALDAVSTRIHKLEAQLKQSRNQRALLTQELKLNEVSIGKLTLKLSSVEQKLKHQQNRLRDLKAQKAIHQDKLEAQQQRLSQQVQLQYRLGHEPKVKLLLHSDDRQHTQRLIRYINIINQENIQHIKRLSRQLTYLKNNETAIAKLTATLKDNLAQQQSQKMQLGEHYDYQKTLVKKIAQQIKTKAASLDTLRQDKKALEVLIKQLKSQAQALAFAKQKHKLPWPLPGKIAHQYGERIANSELSYNGVVIQAPTGQPIQAIAGGKIAFADWLRGFGLLLIIDHGDGYLSLYGHNQSLSKKIGDIVKTGDRIASAGNSGGAKENGLYFEIRHRSLPVNPLEWLSKNQS